MTLLKKEWLLACRIFFLLEFNLTYPARMGEEVRTDRFDVAVSSMIQVADGLEVLLGSPAGGENRER